VIKADASDNSEAENSSMPLEYMRIGAYFNFAVLWKRGAE